MFIITERACSRKGRHTLASQWLNLHDTIILPEQREHARPHSSVYSVAIAEVRNLITELRWLEQDRPDFYEDFVIQLLTEANLVQSL